jgi:hypothetical protein
MTSERISFTGAYNRYLHYSETLSQYHSLEEEDQKIIEPYVKHLKEEWQRELQTIKLKLDKLPLIKHLSTAKG